MKRSLRFPVQSAINSELRNQLLALGVVVLGGLVALRIDVRLTTMAAVAVLATPLLSRNVLVAYYVTVPLLVLFRNLGLKIPFFFFSSPTDLLVTLAVGLGLLALISRRQTLPSSSIYFPILVFWIVGISHAALEWRRISAHLIAVQKMVQGMWPFAIIVLSLRTPRQARYVLMTLLGTFFAAMSLWFPGLAGAAITGNLAALRSTTLTGDWLADVSLSFSGGLRTYLFIVPMSTLASLPLAFFVLVPQYRVWSSLLTVIVILLVFFSSIAAGVISLTTSLAATLVLLILVRNPHTDTPKNYSKVFGLTMTALGLVAVFVLIRSVPIVSLTLNRILTPTRDPSGYSRLQELKTAAAVFTASPILGAPNAVRWYGGHDSVLTYAANWGLGFSLPYFIALLIGLTDLLRLARGSRRVEERALLIGMVASLVANIAASIVTPNLLEMFADLIVWTFVGLAVVWIDWRKSDPEAPLIS